MPASKCFIFLCVFLYVIYKHAVQALICDNPCDPYAIRHIKLKIFNGTSNNYSNVSTTVTEPEKIESLISPNKDTVFYVYGFTNNAESEIVKVAIRAYLDKGDVNFILGDWAYIAENTNYTYDSSNVPGVGKAYAQAIMKLSKVINTSTLHVVGHSLGAHVAAYIARNLNFTLSRLTGLDPAFPQFHHPPCHITDSDAKTVVIAHTDAGNLGIPFTAGTVDFWANGGTNPQPGCNGTSDSGNSCSHSRSVRFYAESLTHPTAFPSRPCRNTTQTASSSVVYFGDSVPVDTRGSYCFDTNAQSPYGQGS